MTTEIADTPGAVLDVHTGVTVENLERSVEFYSDLLGMTVIGRWTSTPSWIWNNPDIERIEVAQLRFPDGRHQLQLAQVFGGEQTRLPGRPWDVGATHIGLVVEDVDKVAKRLEAAGYIPRSGRVSVHHDDPGRSSLRGLFIPDPDGFNVELVQLSQA